MSRWTITWAAWSLAVGVCFAQPSLPTSPTTELLEPVRVRLLHLRLVPFTNSLFLDAHRTAQHVTFSSLTRRETHFGGAIAAVGDANADGFTDVLVSAARHQSDQLLRAGAVTLLTGSSAGLQANTGWSFYGERANRQMGRALVGGLDVNDDSLPDMAVSTLHRMSSGVNRGGLSVFYGSSGTISGSRDWEYLPDEQDSQLGESLAMADVNGDGFADLIAGACRRTKSFPMEGAVLLFLGGKKGLGSAPAWTAFGGATNGGFGERVTTPGDVNGDGFPDLVVGAPSFPVAGKATGRIFLFTGGPAGLCTLPAWVADGPRPHSQFGQTISGVGDVNGEGCSDFVVGAPQRSTDPLPGTVFLFLGSRNEMSTNAAWAVSGEAPGSRFGAAVAGVGDVDGDGLNDVLIGSPELTVTNSGTMTGGRAYLYLGVKGGVDSAPSWMVGGANAFRAGTDLAARGDLNKDGFRDFAIGLPQRSRLDVFYGAATGYHRGDTFPADGISARDMSQTAIPTAVATSSAPAPFASEISPLQPSSRSVIFVGLALLPVVLGGMFAIMLRRQRAATNSERARIAKDLHDDLGARLTRLSLLMDPASRQAGSPSAANINEEMIASTAREILTSMDEVIWSENPQSDTLENLVTFIIQYASPFFAPTHVRCQCDAPTHLPKRKVSAKVRKNIFLAVKEALNNAAKHADATNVRIKIRFAEPALTILIEDNGRGLPVAAGNDASATPAPTAGRGGHGLGNMRQRMIAIGGSFDIRSAPGAGTRVTLQARL